MRDSSENFLNSVEKIDAPYQSILKVKTNILILDSNQDITEENSEDEIVYDPTPYEKLGLRMDTPPPEWQENVENLEPKGKSEKNYITLYYEIFSRFQKPCSLPN